MAVISPLALLAQTEFMGKLDGRLQSDPELLDAAIFDPVSAGDAKLLGVPIASKEKAFAGVLSLPHELKYKAVIVRSPDGSDAIYVDRNQDGHLQSGERTLFHTPASADAHVKSTAMFDVVLPKGLYKTCPMELLLMKGGVPIPAGPKQLAVLYTSSAFIQGNVRLPNRSLQVRFEYGFNNEKIDLGNARQWVDINGDGSFDATPGSEEFLPARGNAPMFRVENLTLQVQSVDPQRERLVLHSVAASLYQRIQFSIGSVLPDFEFTDFAGARHHLSDVNGNYILLDFWATWCVACVQDLPLQKKAYEEFHRQGFEILGMNFDESTKKPEALLNKIGVHWMQARLDKHLFEDRFQISQWPTMVLLDQHHTILSIGQTQHLPLRGEDLSKTLQILTAKNR